MRVLLFISLILRSITFSAQENADKELASKKENVQYLIELSSSHAENYNFDSALYFANKAVFFASHHNAAKENVDALKNLADLYFMKGDHNNAEKYYLLVLPICKKAGLDLEENKVYLNLANVHYLEGKLTSALINCKKALKYFLKVNDKRGISHCYTNIGNIYGALGSDNKLVLSSYLEAYKICEELGDERRLVGALCNVGSAYTNLKDYPNALHYFNLALDRSLEQKDTLVISQIYSNKGNLLADQGYMDKALAELKKAEEFGIASKNNYKLSQIVYSICTVLYDKGDLKGALNYALRALKLSQETNNKECENATLLALSNIEEKLGNTSQALSYLKRHNDLNNSNFGKETVRKIEQAEARIKYESALELSKLNQEKIRSAYEFESQIKALELRRTRLFGIAAIVILILAAAFIALFLRQKKLKVEQENAKLEQEIFRAQMNPHFLFNSLNSIQRMFMEGKLEAANDAVADFSNLLRRILNNSGHMFITLEEEIETLKLYMGIEKIRCDNVFDYELRIDDDINARSIKVPPLIIQPFVENAIWHGILPSKRKGLIILNFHLSEDRKELDCIIQDNGVGIDINKLNNPNSKGIKITEQRLGTKLYFVKLENEGTIVKLKILLQK